MAAEPVAAASAAMREGITRREGEAPGAEQPVSTLRARLVARARLHAVIRGFFADRGVLEVVTPVMAPTGTTDPHIDSWRAEPLGARPAVLAATANARESSGLPPLHAANSLEPSFPRTRESSGVPPLHAANSLEPSFPRTRESSGGRRSSGMDSRVRGNAEIEPGAELAPVMDSRLRGNDDVAATPTRWLRTSPEFFHKRLLADGSGPIYELGPVFRADEHGPRHRPEFTMLEWYRPGWDDAELRAEVADLIAACFRAFGREPLPVQTLSFDETFRRYAGVPAEATPAEYAAACIRAGVPVPEGELDRDGWQDWLRATVIESALPDGAATFITDFPASQAALARLRGDPPVAARFELYLGRHELANGYHELTDAAEQRRRFEADRARRHAQGRDCPPIDEALIAALARGMPDCAGVALGVDRLLMALTGARDIAEVLAFPSG